MLELRERFAELVRQLRNSADDGAREAVAGDLAYLMEAAISAESTNLDELTVRSAVAELLSVLTDASGSLREALLFALVDASCLCDLLGIELDFAPVVTVLNELTEPELHYALWIFAFTRGRQYRGLIGRFIDHPSSEIRECAEEALDEIEGRRRTRDRLG